MLARYARYDVIAIDEVGYVPLADVGAELLFQIIADRTERAALILTTNLLRAAARNKLNAEHIVTRSLVFGDPAVRSS